MSKKTPVKKSKRRLKRSVRRSLAAVLMITAIGVAAIPVPENYAEGENEGEETPTVPVAVYEYPSSLDPIKLSVELSRPATGINKTYNVFTTDENESEGSTFRIEWQYEYFSTKVQTNLKDIICGYNNTYTREELEVSTDPIANYYRVSQKELDDFKDLEKKYVTDEDTKQKLYFLPADPENDPTLTETERSDLLVYFPEEYQARINRYNAYKKYNDLYTAEYKALKENSEYSDKTSDELKALAEANVKNKNGLDPVAQPEDTYLSCQDFLYDWQWYRYYCDRNKTKGLAGCQLEKVADPEARELAGSSTMVYTYIPRVLDASKYNTGDYDALGFYYVSKADFIGIGNNVFKNVRNVKKVILPKDLKYIGDSAFEDSYITSITMANVEEIGNQAFKNCPQLSEVVLETGVTKIGTEAFYGISPLMSMSFPVTLKYIGAGAFANCRSLGKLDFSAVDATDVVIDDYAFYNDIALSSINWIRKNDPQGASVNIISIGEAAFAVDDIVTGSLTEFTFPTAISKNKGTTSGEGSVGLGDYILAGRTNMKTVTMPTSYGSKAPVITIPKHIFYNCINLDSVVFPDTGTSCGLVRYEPDLFASVSNPDFYVQGPPYTNPSDRSPAEPRKSTWDAYTAVASIRDGESVPNVPYIYYLNGKKHIEVSDGDYLESINDTGVLISCSLKDGVHKKPGTVDLIIPAEVAGTTVTGIDKDCFSNDAKEPDDRKMSLVVRSLTLKDGSKIAMIDDSVFANWTKLQRVYLGDSVRNIGNNTFQNCSSLEDVYFNTPEGAVADFKVGTNAFKTNSPQLTFHGPISMKYQPYTEAIAADNTIDDTGRGIRICYKSLSPSNLTVMRDNGTNQVTLLDYPKYDQIETILGNLYAVKNGLFIDGSFDAPAYYKAYMESMYESLYSSDQYNGRRADFKSRFIEANGDAAELEALYTDFTVYGPWISRQWCKEFRAEDTANAESSLLDFFFEPITAYAEVGKPIAYFDYENYGYDVYRNYAHTGEAFGPYQTYTDEEWTLLDATKNVTVPDGVTSIDVNGYMNSGANNGNVSLYLTSEKLGSNTRVMYNDSQSESTLETNRVKDIQGGLFSGKYKDYDSTSGNEKIEKGNDRLESVNLNQVTYLPDYAFDSCEKLNKVTIGAACTDIRKLPFRGCPSLTTLTIAEENPKYSADNRILYAKNDASSYTIIECLESRGQNNDNSVVTSASDVKIPQVTSIADGAFEDCNNVSTINLSDALGLTVVPERAFMDCDGLIEVDLPLSVNKIDKDAFKNDLIGRVKIPGREVFISTNAFNKVDGKTQPTYIITYKDSSARRYADTYGDAKEYYNLVWEDIGELWTVNFYDFDGTLVKSMQIQDGGWSIKTSEVPEVERDGYTFVKWVGTNNVEIQDEITQDTDFIAQYVSNSPMVDGKWVVDFIDGVTGESFWPTQFVEDGKAAEAPPYTPHHEGYKFLKYTKDFTKVTSNMTIVALYEVDAAGNAGGNGTTSGSTTNTSGTTTNTSGTTTNTSGTSSNNNKTSASTTNTSGSSTSTTSSTGATPRHTVTVVNGYGSGSYAEGETVIIVANEPAEGQKFSQWRTESEGVELVMILASATTFKMPANDVLVVAEFTAGSSKPTTTPLQTPASGTVATNTGRTGDSNNNGNTRVDITKPGISNKNLATANVNGSTDNFIVKISETAEATQAVQNALTNKYGSLDDILYYAMDISLYDSTGTTKITDTTGLSVDITIPIPDALVAYGGNNMMGAVVGNDQLEDMSERFTTIGGVPCISFTATHFSPYTIYVNTQNLSEGLLDVTPKTGDPIHPKWFLSIGLAALSILLFMKKDKKTTVKTA